MEKPAQGVQRLELARLVGIFHRALIVRFDSSAIERQPFVQPGRQIA
jgi:hypothetical protein